MAEIAGVEANIQPEKICLGGAFVWGSVTSRKAALSGGSSGG